MKLKFREHHEELLKAAVYVLIIVFVLSVYDSFVGDMGHMATSTKGKGLQALIALLNKIGGKYLVVALFSIPVISSLFKAHKEYKKFRQGKGFSK